MSQLGRSTLNLPLGVPCTGSEYGFFDQNNVTSRLPLGQWPFPFVFNVKSYGAKGNGTADDTTAIQAAINAARVASGICYLPPGTYKFTSPLDVGTGTAPSSLTFQGAGPNQTILNWQGSGAGPAVLIDRQKYTRVSGFRIEGSAAAISAGCCGMGFYSNGSGLFGTVSNGGLVEQVSVDSFATGVQFGGTSSGDGEGLCASEWACIQLVVTNCTTGVYVVNANTQDIHFYLVELSLNQLGMYVKTGNSVHVHGGSCSDNGTSGNTGGGWDGHGGDFYINSPLNFSITGVRSENCAGTPIAVNGASACVCHIHAYATDNTQGAQSAMFENAFCVTLSACEFDKQILTQAKGAYSSLVMQSCYVGDGAPFETYLGSGNQGLRYTVLGCMQLSGGIAVAPFPQRVGYYSAPNTPNDNVLSP